MRRDRLLSVFNVMGYGTVLVDSLLPTDSALYSKELKFLAILKKA